MSYAYRNPYIAPRASGLGDVQESAPLLASFLYSNVAPITEDAASQVAQTLAPAGASVFAAPSHLGIVLPVDEDSDVALLVDTVTKAVGSAGFDLSRSQGVLSFLTPARGSSSSGLGDTESASGWDWVLIGTSVVFPPAWLFSFGSGAVGRAASGTATKVGEAVGKTGASAISGTIKGFFSDPIIIVIALGVGGLILFSILKD